MVIHSISQCKKMWSHYAMYLWSYSYDVEYIRIKYTKKSYL